MQLEKSLLDDITGSSRQRVTRTWANGKRGDMFYREGNCPLIVFDESPKNRDGQYVNEESLKGAENCPVVASGIVALWLRYRNYNALRERFRLVPRDDGASDSDKFSWDYGLLFKNYTDMLFKKLTEGKPKGKACSWDGEWCHYQIYVEGISKEMLVIKRSEALFEYITEDDVEEVRDVMENYIRYLKKCRSDAGYKVSEEWIVLRGVVSSEGFNHLSTLFPDLDSSETDDFVKSWFEDLPEYKIIAELDKLEKGGYIKVAWAEGHDYEDLKILPKGRSRLDELEEAIRQKKSLAVIEGGKPAKNKAAVRPDCCFLYESDDYSFNVNIQSFINILKKHKLVPDDMDFKRMEPLFRGRGCAATFTWLSSKSLLASVIRALTAKDDPILTTWPQRTGKWVVTSQRFVDGDGNTFQNLRKETERKKNQETVAEIVSAFRP